MRNNYIFNDDVRYNHQIQKRNWWISSFKKSLLAIFFLIFASNFVLGQTQSDQENILQQSVDFAAIQQYYPQNMDNSFPAVVIMQFPFTFPSNLGVSKFGQSVLLKTRAEILSTNPSAFISFKSFVINGNTATVEFEFYYNRLTATPSLVGVSLSLEKVSNTWSIINSTLNN